MKHYNVYIIRFGTSAKNAGIITSGPATKADWSTGSLVYKPYDDGRLHFEFDARDDASAFQVLTDLFVKQTGSKKPISGKSYLRACRK